MVTPPALIPIWSTGSRPTYIGLWKHWFSDREPSFVKMYVSSDRRTIEVARTTEQLFSLIAMMSISERDGICQDLVDFVVKVGIQNLDQINSVSLISGDDPRGFEKIDQFRNKTPAESVIAPCRYDGEFPISNFDSTNPWWEQACSFEVSPEVLSAWPTNLTVPPWIASSGKEKLELFHYFLSSDNLKGAWLALNSAGWLISDARIAIAELSLRAKNTDFDLLVDAWLSVADESAGAY